MAKFLHIADLHLDYQQYGIRQRERDAYDAFEAVINYAISEQIDVLLIAGDFFHSKDIRARAWLLVREALSKLKRARIKVIMVEGNHDRALFGTDETWVETLHTENLATVLGSSGQLQVLPFGEVRVIGMPYVGHKEKDVLANIYQHLDQSEPMPTILLCHIGVSEVMGDIVPGLSFDELEAMVHPSVEYIATGHFHRPWSRGRVHCPGTFFPNKVDEPYGGMFQFKANLTGVRDVTYIPITDLCDVRPILQVNAETLDQVAEASQGWAGAIVQLVYRGSEDRETIESVLRTEPMKLIPVFRSSQDGDDRRHYQASSTSELEKLLLQEVLTDGEAEIAIQLMAYALEGQSVDAMVGLVKEGVKSDGD